MLAALMPDPPLLDPGQDDRFAQHWAISRRAMACDFTVHLHPLTRDPVTAANSALQEVEAMEDLLTVYRPTSQISLVNQHAADAPVRVDERVFSLLRRSLELHEQTQGTFDIATGAVIKTWGFFDRNPRVPTAAELAAAMAVSGMRHVELNEAEQTVRYLVPGVEINLGSIGKGYAIDCAARRLRQEFGIECALLTGGSSSMYAWGSLCNDDAGWLIAIEDPDDPNQSVATVRLRDRALGTSNASNQHLEHQGKRLGHLLDPRTGQPADQISSVSVLAPDAATADALATAFFVMGLDKTAEFCQNHPDIAAILVLKNEPNPVNVKTGAGRGPRGHQTGRLNRFSRVLTFNAPPHDVKILTERRDSAPPSQTVH